MKLLLVLEQVRLKRLDLRITLDDQMLEPIARALNAILDVVSALLDETRSASAVVSGTATDMRETAIHLASDAQQQATTIVEASHGIEATAASVRRIADIAQDATAAAADALEVSQNGLSHAEHAVEGMGVAREIALQSLKKMKRLSESSQEIGEIVQLVSDIATKTNLLALNASIEAARASDGGRGFAIVAQEIRNLATGTAEAAKQINTRIRDIQQETSGAVGTIEHGVEEIVRPIRQRATGGGDAASRGCGGAGYRRIGGTHERDGDAAGRRGDPALVFNGRRGTGKHPNARPHGADARRDGSLRRVGAVALTVGERIPHLARTYLGVESPALWERHAATGPL